MRRRMAQYVAPLGGLMGATLAACGTSDPSSGSSSSVQPDLGVYSVQLQTPDASGLPACTRKTGGETAMLTSSMTLESCIAGLWVPIRCTALLGGAVAYDSATGGMVLL